MGERTVPIKIVKYFLFFCLLFAINCNASVVKVAIIDQLMSQKLSSIDYANDYMKGIAIAVRAAYTQFGITVEIKQFSYNKEGLGPLATINDVKNWDPDFIIGPRSSNSFLLLKPYFNNILVISPFSTADQVYNMPNNFYSMSFSDKYSATAIASFAAKNFPESEGVIIIDAVDCISCHDVSKYIAQYYRNNYKNKVVIRHSIIGNNVETIDISTLAKNWEDGYLIFTPNISYVSGVLITRLSNYLLRKNLVFLGDDEWGFHDVGYIGKLKTVYPYAAYHLQDWSLTNGDEDQTLFEKTYFKIYEEKPTDPVSYASFHALYSVVSLLGKDIPNEHDKKQYILNKFLSFIKKNTNGFRQKEYIIYKWDHQLDKDVAVGIEKTEVQ